MNNFGLVNCNDSARVCTALHCTALHCFSVSCYVICRVHGYVLHLLLHSPDHTESSGSYGRKQEGGEICKLYSC